MESASSQNTPCDNWRNSPLWKWIVLLMLAVGAAIALFARFRAADAFMVFFDDDYFYYLRVARNIAAGHGSTFDGTHLTNGYHPLWMLVNAGLAKLFAGRLFFDVLLLLILLCVLMTYWFSRLCLRRYAPEAAAAGCGGLIAAQGLLIMSGGMEVVLTIPLLALLCWYRVRRFTWGLRSAAVYGLLCSAVVLSRLDAAIFVALLGSFELLAAGEITVRQRTRAALAFLAGLLPLGFYFALNAAIFHTFMPISGQAKQLRFTHVPSSMPWETAFLTVWAPLRLFLVIPVTCAAVFSVVLIWRGRGRQRSTAGWMKDGQPALVWALLCFPLAQLTVLSVLSDWVLPPWYLYTFVAAALGVCLVLLSRSADLERKPGRFAAPLSIGACAALVAIFAFVQLRNSERPDKLIYSVYFAARDLSVFAKTHPGIYAMGDHAGIPSLLIHEPIVQVEGLVMDKTFLSDIRQRRDLKNVLESYEVRYYVSSNPTPVRGCLGATEPAIAGPTSYVMRGIFCSVPVDHFLYQGRNTYVMDMEKERESRDKHPS
jgi:hypothetical protein